MSENQAPRNYLITIIKCYCPRCREGKLFKHSITFRFNRNMQMVETCKVCGQLTDIEVGFYYGTSYVSYLIALILSGVSFLLWWLLIGFSFTDDRFIWWIILNSLLLIFIQPWLMRFSRSLWLSLFVSYDQDWPNNKPGNRERIIDSQMNNW